MKNPLYKKSFQFVKLFLMGLLAVGSATLSAQTPVYNLVWADEFTSSISSDWVFETGAGGWGNGELETYTNGANAAVVNGELQITARKEANGTVTSTRIKTQGRQSWKYGKIEARIKLPSFDGSFPAFWSLGNTITTAGWPACGEIDIMESINKEMTTYGTVHWDSNGHAQYGGSSPIVTTDYNIYSIEWNASSIRWFVNGTKYNEVSILNGTGSTQEFHDKFFILLNLAFGGNWPTSKVPVSLASFPAQPQVMCVDYVRVYQQEVVPVVCGTTFIPMPATIQAEDYCQMAGLVSASTTDFGGGMHLGSIDNNDWSAYSINVPVAGNYTINYRVASAAGGGSIQLEELGGSAVYTTTNVAATGGLDKWVTLSQSVTLPAGNHTIAIKALTGGFNLNWFSIQPESTTVIEAENYDNGGANVSFYDLTATNQGGQYRTDAVDIEAGGTGFNVGYIGAGEWMQYSIPNLAAGTYDVSFSTASALASAGKSITLKIDGVSLGQVTPALTNGWNTWQTQTISKVKISGTGSKLMRLEFAAGDFNLDYIKFVKGTSTSLFKGVESNDQMAQVFPSPVSDVLNVSSNYGTIDLIEVYTISGVKILSASSVSSIAMGSLNPGIYLVTITIKGKVIIKKVAKV